MLGLKGPPAQRSDGPITTKVRAILRARPLLCTETAPTRRTVLDIIEQSQSARIANPRNISETLTYQFDSCYGPEARQSQIFMCDVVPIVNQTLDGYSATIFAYGNTGAGKTFTMEGTDSNPGMIPLTVQHLLESLRKRKTGFLPAAQDLQISYLEIYKERVYDLLSANPTAVDLPIREDTNHNIIVPDLTQVRITTLSDFERLWAKGVGNRRTAATKLNAHSSRSHACLTIHVPAPVGGTVRAKLHLIDLAGSEDNRRTANAGERLIESGAINKSLFVLGQVVDALNTSSNRIPYRDSKLTRLLQDALGGRAYALVIANVAPNENFLLETCNTLNFASKSRLVENAVKLAEEVISKRSRYGEEPVEQRGKRVKSSSPATISSADIKKEKRQGGMKDDQENNPFTQGSTSSLQTMILERRIEEKVAQKLREISKGTILSPLLKGDTRALIRGGSPLAKLAKEKKPRKPRKPADDPLDPQVAQIMPHVEPELLRIINYGSLREIKELKEIGVKRAQSMMDYRESREGREVESLAELVEATVLTNKTLGKIVLANALGHVDFVPAQSAEVRAIPAHVRHNPIIMSDEVFE